MAEKTEFVDLQLIWDHAGKQIIDTATGENLSTRYGITQLIAVDGCLCLKLAPGIDVQIIDTRYVTDCPQESQAKPQLQ